jgi:hypothetical protein
VIAADETFDVPSDDKELEQVEIELRAWLKTWPSSVTKSTELSVVTADCRSCRFRHRCPSYLSTSPWLPESEVGGERPATWQWDVWGTLLRTVVQGKRHSLVVSTPDGRRVIVNGLEPSMGVGTLSVGTRIGVFGLVRGSMWSEAQPELSAITKDGKPVPVRLLAGENAQTI